MPIQHVTPDEADRIRRSDPQAVYLDVRSVPEFTQGHPTGAYNIPLLHLDPVMQDMQPNPDFERVARSALDPQRHLLVGCKSGGRSLRAAQMLEGMGFTHITNVLGGYGGGEDAQGNPVKGWAECALPTSRSPEPGHDYESLRQAAR